MLFRRFAEQVRKTPDRIAVKSREHWLTYRELNEYALRISRRIKKRLPQADQNETIGLLFDHGIDMIAAILAALNAGKIYVPLSADYPKNRLAYMLTHSQSSLILTNTTCESTAGELAAENYISFFNINRIEESLSEPESLSQSVPGENPGRPVEGKRLAYIMYTSGSTGRPKGVKQTHENVWYYIRHWVEKFSIGSADRMTLFSSFCHDASVPDVFAALLEGAVLYPLNMKDRDASEGVTEFLVKERITIWHSVPSLFNYFVNTLSQGVQFKDLRFILLGGEPVRHHEIEVFKRYFPYSVLVNIYGQTESTFNSAWLVHPQDTVERFIIGPPLEETEIFVVDAYGNEADALRTGEILIACPYLSPGYWRDEEETARCFDTDEEFGRLYWTGDLGRLLLDGAIEFIGRKDAQVKIRGFRIEPGEIESHLLRHPQVKEAVVTAREDKRGDKYLCAYMVLHSPVPSTAAGSPGSIESFDPSVFREYLSRELPDYMVPSFYIRLDRFPLTRSNKIDRKALPEPEFSSGREYIPPRDEIEKTMVAVWSEVLEIPADTIGMKDSFFELGGHSLRATVLVYKLHKALDVRITLSRVFKTPTVRALCRYVKETVKQQYTGIPAVEKRDYYILSPAQKRLYILQQMDIENTGYNMPTMVELGENPDREKLRRAFSRLIKRHASLRTSFHMVEEKPVQKIHEFHELEFEIENYRVEAEVKVNNGVPPLRAFDLSHAPLLRVGILKLNGRQNILMTDMHHIITDGTSQRILVEDFIKLFNGETLPPLKLQYNDYARWQHRSEQQEAVIRQETYWLEQFRGEIPVLHLPFDFPRPALQSFEGRTLDFSLSAAETGGLNSLASRQDATLYMVLVGIINILLAKLSGQEDIVLGTAVAGRGHAELQAIIGMFVNTLALRNYPAGGLSFRELLNRVKKRTLEAFENQEYPFEDLVEKVEVVKDTSRNPLFDVMFTLQNLAEFQGELPEEDSVIEKRQNRRYERGVSKFDLTLTAVEVGQRLMFSLQYCSRLFKQDTVKRFIAYFKRIVTSVLENPLKKISAVEIILPGEKQWILHEFNDTGSEYPRDKTIHELFELQVEKTPDRIAVVGNHEGHEGHEGFRCSISFMELNKKSNRLAGILQEQGVQPDTIAGIMMERSLEMIIGILGILKAGGAYLPIDPGYPQERINYMLKDSGATILVTAGTFDNIYRSYTSYRSYGANKKPATCNLHLTPAYIIYTSGTTGRPKGTLISHYNVVKLIKNTNYINLTPGDRILQLSNYVFDGSVFDIFGALLSGSQLVMVEQETILAVDSLADFIKREEITVFLITTALFNTVVDVRLDCFKNVRKVFFGGEKVSFNHSKRALEYLGKDRIIHAYGPTEATVYASCYFLNEIDEQSTTIPIGKPTANTTIYILDCYLKLVPIGVIGEIYIGGDGLARGYLNRVELTAERFIFYHEGHEGTRRLLSPFTFHLSPLYKTGDLAKQLPDGNIEFIGRVDDQVKIRGFRIELAEIENQLMGHDDIKEAVVTVKEGKAKDQQYLCAYIAVEKEVDIPGLRRYLSGKLPAYMIPAYFIHLEKLPLTANGKVDRKALPAPVFKPGEDYVPPGNEIEEKLAVIWSELLGIEKGTIGIDASFFELGGHSLKATILISKIHRDTQVKIPLAEIFKSPTIRELSQYIIKTKKDRYASINPIEKKDYYPLSSAQKRLYILRQMESDNVSYNMARVIPLPGDIDRQKLESIFKTLISRHESLRTSFHLVDDQPVQRINKEVEFKIQDYRVEVEAKVEEVPTPRAFDLSRTPLLRVGLVKTADAYRLLVDMHHIITDGTSQTVLIDEFKLLAAGEKLSPLRLHYKDYSQWQTSEEQQIVIKKQEVYWLKLFSDELPVLNLPTDYPRPLIQSFAGSTVNFVLSDKETRALKDPARETKATLFMAILSVFNILLSKLSGQEDIVVGTPIAARRHADLERIIGMFVNTLALRNQPSGDKTFKEFLLDVKKHTLEAFENQEYQFEELVEKVTVPRDTGRNPLFDVMFNLLNQAEYMGEIPGMNEQSAYAHRQGTAKFDLTLTVVDTGKRLLLAFNYSTKLFTSTAIERMISYFRKVLHLLTGSSNQKLSGIEIITAAEKHQILYEFNDTKSEYPGEKTIGELFAEQAGKKPDNIALAGTANGLGPAHTQYIHHISYKKLNTHANQLAKKLKKKGMVLESTAGIMLERSLDMPLAIIAVLKAGGAYLPIDPEYPAARKEFILRDSSAMLLITRRHLPGKNRDLPGRLSSKSLFLDDNEGIHSREIFNPDIIKKPGSLAYVIYTSGTTGKPKGVMVEERNVVRLVKNTNYIEFRNDDRILQTGALAFDASTFEIWGALLNGLRLILLSKENILSAEQLKEVIGKYKITIMWMTSSLFNQMLDTKPGIFFGLRNLLVGGEALSPKHINKLRERFSQLKVINGYGPTENTTFSTTYLLEREYEEHIPIGKPIANSTAYIVNDYHKLQPPGLVGELCVGGDGVARGYLSDPELTAEKFIENLFVPGERLYKTGDLGRWLSEGNIEFLGRKDDQVKIRGFRIELAEIESELLSHKDVKEAVVTIRQGEAEPLKYLCAYIIPAKEVGISELRSYLSKKLPDYMIPSHFVEIEHIPLTSNGKVDMKALPQPEFIPAKDFVPPGNEIEEKLAELWSDVLGIKKDNISIDANFFELGGHSLKATILASKIHKEMNIKAPLAEIFKAPSIREFSKYIKEAEVNRYASIEPAEQKDYYAVSSVQKRLYILQKMEWDNINYNMPQVIPVTLTKEIDKQKLASIFKTLISRHESLRTSFHLVDDQPVQRIDKEAQFAIEYFDFATEDTEVTEEHKFVRPFDLSQAPLLRVGLLKTKDKYRLLLDMHHIITDGTSQAVLIDEFKLLAAGEALRPLRLQYKDYSQWQTSEEQQTMIKKQEVYWLKLFSDELPVLNLPTDYPRPLIQSFAGSTVNFVLSDKETRALKDLAQETKVTLFMAILSVFNILLSKLSGQEDIVVGTPIAARRHADLERIIGMFVNTLALRNRPSGDKAFKEFLQQVKKHTLEAFENQEYQFEELVESVSVPRDTGRNPLFDVMFNLLNQVEYIGKIPKMNKQPPVVHKQGTAKFDLTLTAVDLGEHLFFTLEYCTKLFEPGTIERMISYFRKILHLSTERSNRKLLEIEIITAAEKHRLLYEFNDTASGYPQKKTINELFEEQAEHRVDGTALVDTAKTHITYRELNQRAKQLALLLHSKGVQTDTIVGIMLERSLEMIIGILAILKARGAYLPIDPGYPDERISYMLADSGAAVLVTAGTFDNIYRSYMSYRSYGTKTQPVTRGAYIIYTSGSTGKPKGVMIEHASVVNLLSVLQNNYPFRESDTYLLKTSYIFDVSITELFGWFLAGGKLAILEKGGEKDPQKILATIEKAHISHINFVPSMFNVFVDSLNQRNISKLSGLRYIFLAGEALLPELVNRFKRLNTTIALENLYGPTEAAVYASSYSLSHWKGAGAVPIGKPLGNVKLYILDKNNCLQPIGVVGELCIAGVGVARGYLNNPELTAERFVFYLSPFTFHLSLYLTGDLARWLPDGNIEFLGRLDHQVKIRGYRIELGEIENRLLKHDKVKEAVVLVLEKENGDNSLCAYIVSPSPTPLNRMEVKEYLSHLLSDYMVPSHFVEIEQIPLTLTGKVDRKALPHPEFKPGEDFIPPGNKIEKILARIWSEVLGIKKDIIGINTGFFQLGGHSLKAAVLVSKLKKEFNVDIPLVNVFKTPNIKQLAEYIKSAEKEINRNISEDGHLVLLKKGKQRANHLFFIHDGSGEVEGYVEFCSRLTNPLNCWGIKADRFDNYAPKNLTIEEVAHRYVKIMQTLQPRGPYWLAGWSLGGIIAFEMIRQMEQRGENIRFLGIIDAAAPNNSRLKAATKFTAESELNWIQRYLSDPMIIKKLRHMTDIDHLWRAVADYLESFNPNRQVIEKIKRLMLEYEALIIPDYKQMSAGILIKYVNVGKTFRKARTCYTPAGKINTPIHYFKASQSKGTGREKWEEYSYRPVKCCEITGDHYSIFRLPGVIDFAKAFDRIIKNIKREKTGEVSHE